MHPILFNIGSFNLFTYAVLLTLAYVVGVKMWLARARARGLNPTYCLNLAIIIIFSALAGAKLLEVGTSWRSIATDPGSLIGLAGSGGVFYGGLILAIGMAGLYIRHVGLPPWTTCDVAAPCIALAHVVGRFGCFFAGCCYGKPTTLPWGITFTNLWAADYQGTPLDVPLHPTQLYEAGAEALIFMVLMTTESRGRPFAGRTFWLYLFLYALSRFVIEFFRGDPRGSVGVFSTSQLISVLLVPAAIAMLVYLGRRGRQAVASGI